MVRHWTAVLEVVGSNPALAKQRIKFLGLLRVQHRQGSLPARVGLLTVFGVTGCATRLSVSAAGGTPVGTAISIPDKTTVQYNGELQ